MHCDMLSLTTSVLVNNAYTSPNNEKIIRPVSNAGYRHWRLLVSLVPATFPVRIDTLWSFTLTSDVHLTKYLDPSAEVWLGWS